MLTAQVVELESSLSQARIELEDTKSSQNTVDAQNGGDSEPSRRNEMSSNKLEVRFTSLIFSIMYFSTWNCCIHRFEICFLGLLQLSGTEKKEWKILRLAVSIVNVS